MSIRRRLPALAGVFLSLCVALLGDLVTGLASNYQPLPLAKLNTAWGVIGLAAVIFSAIVLVRHLIWNPRQSWRALIGLALAPSLVALVLMIATLYLTPHPPRVLVHYQGHDYAVPRAWAPEAGENGFVLQVWIQSLGPLYGGRCDRCSGAGTIHWSRTGLRSHWQVGFFLRDTGVSRNGDFVVTASPEAHGFQPRTFGTVSGFLLEQYKTFFATDDTGLVTHFVKCNALECQVVLARDDGYIRLYVPPEEQGDAAAWEKRAADWWALRESWRCEQPGCAERDDVEPRRQ
jgi:hypothetical protein